MQWIRGRAGPSADGGQHALCSCSCRGLLVCSEASLLVSSRSGQRSRGLAIVGAVGAPDASVSFVCPASRHELAFPAGVRGVVAGIVRRPRRDHSGAPRASLD